MTCTYKQKHAPPKFSLCQFVFITQIQHFSIFEHNFCHIIFISENDTWNWCHNAFLISSIPHTGTLQSSRRHWWAMCFWQGGTCSTQGWRSEWRENCWLWDRSSHTSRFNNLLNTRFSITQTMLFWITSHFTCLRCSQVKTELVFCSVTNS